MRIDLVPAALLLLSCAGPRPLGRPPREAVLEVACEPPAAVALLRVADDGAREVARSPVAARHTFAVLPGAWVVRATTSRGDVSLPAPMFEAVLPTDRTVRVEVRTPPPAAASDRDFAFVPAGPALIGDTLGIGQEDERPARLVDVGAFWLARRECTNAEFCAFLDASEPAVDAAWCAFDSLKCLVRRDATTGRWTTPQPELPVVTVSLVGAEAYCAWRTRTTGRRHRLPTEIEWEKAARGPESFVYAYGDVYRRDAANQESGTLRPVAQHAPNGYGVFDLTGNAFEWTASPYRRGLAAGLGADQPLPDPPAQVLRGGSFVLDGMYLRNSFRMWQRPDVRTDDFGFRVARDAEGDPAAGDPRHGTAATGPSPGRNLRTM